MAVTSILCTPRSGADAQASVSEAQRREFLEVGVAYVGFAVDHRPHFEVMHRPDLHAEDPTVRAARKRASEPLYPGGRRGP
ncbi:hypothetical protein [Actinomycetospora sp. NBC_00405]|uniref:hypothetical protein n=1 Tax=Actinomycetospora sp. NBC_00405 TaxID=2975952 RepID=UPI002E242A60